MIQKPAFLLLPSLLLLGLLGTTAHQPSFGRSESPDDTPLVIDCTGPDHTDCNGNTIPIGVQVRPFEREGWYYQSFAHASRIITAE